MIEMPGRPAKGSRVRTKEMERGGSRWTEEGHQRGEGKVKVV